MWLSMHVCACACTQAHHAYAHSLRSVVKHEAGRAKAIRSRAAVHTCPVHTRASAAAREHPLAHAAVRCRARCQAAACAMFTRVKHNRTHARTCQGKRGAQTCDTMSGLRRGRISRRCHTTESPVNRMHTRSCKSKSAVHRGMPQLV